MSEDNYLEVATALWRRFVGVAPDEWLELVAFCNGKPWVAYVDNEADHVRLLTEAESLRGFAGAYVLVNPIDPAIRYRYEPHRWTYASAGRASDSEMTSRRTLYVDVDPIRPRGISSTPEQYDAARAVADAVEGFIAEAIGADAVARGTSGNGFYLLVPIDPLPEPKKQNERVRDLLGLLARRFGTPTVKIDCSVFNAARLTPAPGTWKRKGVDTPERPHRRVMFCPPMNPRRVALEVLI